MQYKSVGDLIRKLEQEDKLGETTISKYVKFNLRENIEKIDAYLNSKHTSGETDSQGREKPFFNIVKAAVNIWYRATDIDRKNIRVKSTKRKQVIIAFIATILLSEWMKKAAFGKYLNKWGLTLARYCSAVSKFVEKDGELYSDVIPWNRIICDPIDFDNNPKIEILWYTPAQLRKNKAYDKEMVEKLIEAVSSRETMDGQKKDNRSDYIKVYEVHGELPLSYLTDKEKDEDEYRQQMNVSSFVAKKDNPKEFDDFTLYRGAEEKDPYSIDHLIEEDGRVIGVGAVESLFESQWMMNHNTKAIKDQLDTASKIVFQTADGNFVGQNTLTDIENGDILIHQPNAPLTELNNASHDITALQNYGEQWMALSRELTNTPEAQRGESPNAGTAWRLQETVIQQSQSLFELMTENKGLALEEKIRKYIIPYLKKKMDTSEEIAAILEDHQINKIDEMFAPNEAIRKVNNDYKEKILNGEMVYPEEQDKDIQNEEQAIRDDLSGMGNQRFIKPSSISTKTWKEVLKDFEWEVEVDVTGEGNNMREDMATLSTVFQTIANPATAQVLNTPQGKLIFNKILQIAGGISPLELDALPKQTPALVGGNVPAQMPQFNNSQNNI